ncbi:hypothetical protein KSS87_005102 [Heliosperma pusillum]|nr:hypothetical protein KSS87_005102 [Heliosperma pusillum]
MGTTTLGAYRNPSPPRVSTGTRTNVTDLCSSRVVLWAVGQRRTRDKTIDSGQREDAERWWSEVIDGNSGQTGGWWLETMVLGGDQAIRMEEREVERLKARSKFEFQLRLQEFIELVRADDNLRAIAYARKYLAPWGATHTKEFQRVVATLAFRSSTECITYKVLFEPKQWDHLVDQFKQEFCKLYGMTLEPLLNIYLQAGLSALKTPYPSTIPLSPCRRLDYNYIRFCYEDDCPKDDPLSQESFRKLASSLPFSKQHHSKLVCYITKELMDTENPPMVLPNGYVYSTKALEEMARRNNGKITCPRTGVVCNYSDLAKAYIS